MKKMTLIPTWRSTRWLSIIPLVVLLAACGTPKTASELPSPVSATDPSAGPMTPNTDKSGNTSADKENEQPADDQEILIVIDQEPLPLVENNFSFSIVQVPEGYSLSSIQWLSDKHHITNTIDEILANGAGESDDKYGFSIGGSGNFSSFVYPAAWKGEKGTVIFTFKNEQGDPKTWKKQVVLKIK